MRPFVDAEFSWIFLKHDCFTSDSSIDPIFPYFCSIHFNSRPQSLPARRPPHSVVAGQHSAPAPVLQGAVAVGHSALAPGAVVVRFHGAGHRASPWIQPWIPYLSVPLVPSKHEVVLVFHIQWHYVASIEIWDLHHGLPPLPRPPSARPRPSHVPPRIRGADSDSSRRRRRIYVESSSQGQHRIRRGRGKQTVS